MDQPGQPEEPRLQDGVARRVRRAVGREDHQRGGRASGPATIGRNERQVGRPIAGDRDLSRQGTAGPAQPRHKSVEGRGKTIAGDLAVRRRGRCVDLGQCRLRDHHRRAAQHVGIGCGHDLARSCVAQGGSQALGARHLRLTVDAVDHGEVVARCGVEHHRQPTRAQVPDQAGQLPVVRTQRRAGGHDQVKGPASPACAASTTASEGSAATGAADPTIAVNRSSRPPLPPSASIRIGSPSTSSAMRSGPSPSIGDSTLASQPPRSRRKAEPVRTFSSPARPNRAWAVPLDPSLQQLRQDVGQARHQRAFATKFGALGQKARDHQGRGRQVVRPATG